MATLTIDGTMADSIGTSSIRSIWAIVRSATIRGAVRPDASPSRRICGVGRHERRIGVEPRDERLEALGRVGRLELGELRQELLRAAHLVDDAELVEAPGRPPRSASSAMTWSMSRVIRSSVGRPSVWMAAASAAVRSISARARARPSGPGSSRRSA